MVTDRKIIAGNGNTSVELTMTPYTVQEIKGFDRMEVQNVMSQGFDQDGASLLNSYVLPREMEITGQMIASTTYEMQMNRDRIMNVFRPKSEITITHFYGGINRCITARVEKTPRFEFTEVNAVQNYSLSLIAVEPYWRDESETLIEIANVVGDFHFPLTIPQEEGVCFGIKSSALIANVHNKSSIKAGMRIVFVAAGALSNPQLFDVNKRKFIRLLCEMEAGEQITVMTGQEKTITRNRNGVKEDYIGKIDLAGGGNAFLVLEPGDNLFRHGADKGEDMLETRIYFYNRYPGV